VQIVAALIIALGAFIGIYAGAVYAAQRLFDQLNEERRLAGERLDAEAQRLQMQLNAESDRLQMQLDAAAERLTQQLRADRENQNRTELRDVLDSGAELLAKANGEMYDANSQATRAEKREWSDDDERGKKFIPAVEDYGETVEAFGSYWQRLLLHFKHKDSITVSVDKAMDLFGEGMRAVYVPRKQLDKERLSAMDEKHDEFNGAYVEFLYECRKRFGVTDD
jgi:hypothetical protein